MKPISSLSYVYLFNDYSFSIALSLFETLSLGFNVFFVYTGSSITNLAPFGLLS